MWRQAKTENPEPGAISVLLVENNPDHALLARRMLTDARGALFSIEQAGGLRAGLRRLAEGAFDVILSDLDLPDSYGLDTLSKLHEQAPEVPIVVLTCLDDEILAAEALQRGAQDFLVKGRVDGDVLTRSIRYAVERQSSIQALRASEDRLRRIIRQNADAIVVVDRTGMVRFVNPTAESLFGREAKEFVGELFGFPISGGEEVDINVFRMGGEITTAEMRVTSVEWEDETLYLASLRDITERKRIEKELKETNTFLQNILESSSSISIISTDLEGNILYWNVGAENIFGYKAEEVVGTCKIGMLYDDAEETEKKIEEVRTAIFEDKKGASCEVREVTRDGRKLWINLSLTPRLDENGQVIGILGIGEDITERKEIDRMKSEIISIVSHELRSPLTSILTALTLVADGETGDLPEEAKRMIDIAHRNSERLLRLINDMLDLKKIESGKMEFHLQPLELTSLVEQAVETNHAYAQQFGVRLALEGDLPEAMVNADSDRLMQVLTNLLSNAARYSPPSEAVDVSISRHNGAVRIAVTDHGPGIPEEFRSRIFEQFAQAQSPGARKKGGSGLGLSIAKAIVERMGGQIGFETEVDVGTTFYFDLPEYHPLPARTMGEGKILVMDDERLVRDITTEMLSNLGYEVTASMHGADAIEVYQEAKESGQPYDAVIVDIVVPGGMGGEETIQKLAEIDPEVKAVAGSGYSNNPIMADFRKYGFSDAIAKPYEIGELSEVLHRVIMGAIE
jgi:PAS domain S-box-containing protein